MKTQNFSQFKFLFFLLLFSSSLYSQNSRPIKKSTSSQKKNIITEKCYCCGAPYEKGNGFFYYFEAGRWYSYEERSDVFKVAEGRYSCSRKCAKECKIPRSSFYDNY